jgi:hypothetical protein
MQLLWTLPNLSPEQYWTLRIAGRSTTLSKNGESTNFCFGLATMKPGTEIKIALQGSDWPWRCNPAKSRTIRATGRRKVQDRGFAKTCTPPRSSDPRSAELAPQNALSSARELGVRQPSESGKEPVLGTTASSSSHPTGRARTRHHEADWMAHLPQNILHAAPRYWCGVQGHAGAHAAFNNPRHSGYLHPSRNQ